MSSDLLVADLTDHNPNVYYELAIRHAVGKPFVQLIAESQILPFDIQGLRTIKIDHKDLDSVAAARRTLSGMIQSIREGKPVETPLTHAVNIKNLQQSDSSESRGIANIMSEIQSLKDLIHESTQLGAKDQQLLDHAINVAQALSKYIESMVSRKKLGADELREMIYAGASGDLLRGFAKSMFDKYYPNEPPF